MCDYNIDESRALPLSPEEIAFFGGNAGARALYEALAARLRGAFPDARTRVQKTQISFDCARLFACASLAPVRPKAQRPEPFLIVTFGLPYALESPRALCVPVRPNRWTHHVIIGKAEDIDGELMAWLQEAHDFANR